jgi:drug/metabolite transporter (DMT)-like permease
MYIGFFFWYKGIAIGGIARVGQVQLLQPFLTLIGAYFLLSEEITAMNIGFAFCVLAVVVLGMTCPLFPYHSLVGSPG